MNKIFLLINEQNVVTSSIVYDPNLPLAIPEGYLLEEYTGQGWINWIRNSDGSFSEPPNKTEEPPNP